MVMKYLAHSSYYLRSLPSSIENRSPAPGQVCQSYNGAFRPAHQEPPAPIQDRLLAATQQFSRLGNGSVLIGPQDDQDPTDQPGIPTALSLRPAQFSLLLAAELDPVFVRFASDGTETSF